MTRQVLPSVERVVVKVGSQALHDDPATFGRIAAMAAKERKRGRSLVVVSSGAIALGMPAIKAESRPTELARLQAAAAAGQAELMARWGAAFSAFGLSVAQVLLTHGDLVNRRRYLNARAVLAALDEAGVIAIVNENDAVSAQEIKLGDNDVLAAEVCGLSRAELLLLLTSAEGLMSGDPAEDVRAERIPYLEVVDDDARELAAGGRSSLGTGGMATKLEAARVAAAHGAHTVIASAAREDVLADVLARKDVGTLIPARAAPARARKRWIATTLRPRGRIAVDEGAKRALLKSASLLFAGVLEVDGAFDVGECVEVAVGEDVFARGLTSTNAERARAAAGKRARELQAIFGDEVASALIHRDDLVLLSAD